MSFLTVCWADKDQTMIRAEYADGRVVFIPPDPGNADYRALLEGVEGSPPIGIGDALDTSADSDPD